jgi:hypothetical protein
MSGTAYEPRPGTVPYRVLSYLETQPHGAEVLTSTIAEATGIAPSSIPPCMEAAITAGAVFRRKRDGHIRAPAYWSLVDHAASRTPPPASTQIVVPKPDSDGTTEDAKGRDAGLISTRKAAAARHSNGEGVGHAERRPTPPEASSPVEKPEALRGKNAAWWMTGELAVEAEDGTVIVFDSVLAAKLVGFLCAHGRGAAC